MADETDSELYFPVVSPAHALNRRHHNVHPSTESILFDMRKNSACEKGLAITFSDRRRVAEMYSIPLDHAVDGPQHCLIDGKPVKILTAERNIRKFLIKFQGNAYCVRIQENTTVNTMQENIQQIIHSYVKEYQNGELREAMYRRKSVPAVYDLVLKCLKNDCSMALVCNSRQLSVSEILRLPDWAVVELVLDVPLSWRITYRHKVFCDKTYLIRCRSNDSLASVKCKFLELLKTSGDNEKPGPSADCVWFVQRDKVVTDALVKQNVEAILPKVSNRVQAFQEYRGMIIQEDEMIQIQNKTKPCLTLSRFQNDICVDGVFVYFVPPDAVCAHVVVKGYGTETETGCVMVSPQQTVDAVREEIAKHVERETTSISVSLGCVELDSKVNLHQALSENDSKFTVTRNSKISLFADVHTLGDDEVRKYTAQVYSHEKVVALKAGLCEWAQVAQPSLDLLFDGRLLTGGSWSEHRIHDGDHLEARLYPSRQTVWVRLPTRRWCLLEVDHGETAMVADLKAFCRTMEDDAVGGSPLTAIGGDRAMCDTDVVADLARGETHTPRLILVQTDNPCFTEDTAYKGTHIVYRQREDRPWFDTLLSKYSQEFKHHGPEVNEEKVDEMLEKRRTMVPEHRPVTGIRLAMQQTQSQQPEHSTVLNKHAATQTDITNQTSRSVSVSDTSHLETKRPSVHFHTGNSCSDFDTRSDGEEQGDSLEDRDVESVDGEGMAGVSEDPQDGHGDWINPAEALNARDFTTTDKQEVFGEDKKKARVSQPGNIARSKSCPPFKSRQKPDSLSLADGWKKMYDSDTGDGTELTRIMLFKERCKENPDGTWTMTSEAQLPPERMQQHLSSFPFLSPQSPLLSIKDSQGKQLQAEQHQGLTTLDPTYRNIDAEIIRWIAKKLGRDGLMVMRELGVSEETIEEATGAHPQHMCEKYMYCLRAWLKQMGCEANMDVLKLALRKCQRRDLVRILEELSENPAQVLETTDSEDGAEGEAKK